MFISAKYRRTVARLFLPIFTVWMCIVPARSYAFVFAPALVPITVAAVDSAAVATSIDVGATAVATFIGASISYFLFQDSNLNKVRIPITLDPSKVPPAPSAPVTARPVLHLDPAVTYTISDNSASVGHGCGTGSGLSFADACAAHACVGGWTQVANNGGAYNAGVKSIVDYTCTYWAGRYTNQKFYGATSLQCDPGYTVSGSSCVLSNSRLVTPDKATDYQRIGTTLSPIPDVDTATNPVKGSVNSTGAYEFAGTDSTGNPVQIVITPVSSGGSTVQINKQGTDVAGNTVTTALNLSINDQGIVEGAHQAQTNNAVSVNPATQTATVIPTGNVAQNPTKVTPVSFPSDYARTGEAVAAANTLTPKLDTLHADLNPSTFIPPSSVDPVTPMQDRINSMSTLPANPSISWMPSILPGNATSCIPIPWNMHFTTGLLAGIGGDASIDICSKLDLIRQILGYLFMVGTTVFVYRRFVRGNQVS